MSDDDSPKRRSGTGPLRPPGTAQRPPGTPRPERPRPPRKEGQAISPTGTPIDSIGGVPLPRRRGEPKPPAAQPTPAPTVEEVNDRLDALEPEATPAERMAEIVDEEADQARAKARTKKRRQPKQSSGLKIPLALAALVLAGGAALMPVASENSRRTATARVHQLVVDQVTQVGVDAADIPRWIADRDMASIQRLQGQVQTQLSEALKGVGQDIAPADIGMRLDRPNRVLTVRVDVPDLGAMFMVTTAGEDRSRPFPQAGFGVVLKERMSWVLSLGLVGLLLAALPWLYPSLRERFS